MIWSSVYIFTRSSKLKAIKISLLIVLVFSLFMSGIRIGRLNDENKKLKEKLAKQEQLIEQSIEKVVEDKVEDKTELIKKQIFGQTNEKPLPNTFPLFRAMIELQPSEAMTEKEVTKEISKLISLIKSSPSCEDIKVLMLAGACDDGGDSLVFRILKSNATDEKGK